ncbi:MAG: 6-phosphofructokinase [Clostridiales bacterium]|nr:6-phosphofructokinase [Clostridiales bacterium]
MRVALLTSGGDCPGLNAAIRAIGKSLFGNAEGVELFGMCDGFSGLIRSEYIRLRRDDLAGILTEGGTILGTSRQSYVPGKAILDEDGNDAMPAMMRTYEALGLDCLVVMGGNGTQKGALLMQNAGMNVVTLPKTIDNDIYGTDTTFGFQSAANIATQVIDYIHTTASSHRRIFLVELMGRDAGWLTLTAGISSGADVVLIPEIPYDIHAVAAAIEERRRHGRNFSILAVAEGAVSRDDAVLDEETSRRRREQQRHPTVSYHLAELLEEMTGQETRVTIPGHFQRGGPPCPHDRLLATRFGAEAARLIMEGRFGRMVAMQNGQITSVPLTEAASRTKFLSPDDPVIRDARQIGICFGD